MKKHRNLILVLVSLSCVAGSIAWIRAQVSPPMAVMHSANHIANRKRPTVSATHGMVAQVSKQLGLSQEQERQVEKIVDAAQPQMAAIHSDKSITPQKQIQGMSKALDDIVAKVSKILTPTQQAQFKQMVAEMRSQHSHQ